MSDDEMMCHSDTCGRSLKDGGCPYDDPTCHYCHMCDAHFYCDWLITPQPCKLCGELSCDGKYDHGDDCPYKFEGEEE